jgi:hypothetical protein
MSIDLHYDLRYGYLTTQPGGAAPLPRIRIKAGDPTPITIRFFEAGEPLIPTTLEELIFVIKAGYGPGDPAVALLITEDWEEIEDSGSDPEASGIYTATLLTDTVPIRALLADAAIRTLRAEITVRIDNGLTSSTLVVPAAVHNDLWKGDELSPSLLPTPDDEWVAHGHPQTLTEEQQEQACENIGIEPAATADQTGAEIKAAYEAEADTNAFTDAEKTKVGHITVTQAVDLDAIEAASATADRTYYFDDAEEDGAWATLGNWWRDEARTIAAAELPGPEAHVVVLTFAEISALGADRTVRSIEFRSGSLTSASNTLYCQRADFLGIGGNQGTISAAEAAYFSGHGSFNNGDILGNAFFTGLNSINGEEGSVSGTGYFRFLAANEGTCGDPRTVAFRAGAADLSHTHVSADITDATSAATPSTLVLRGENGEAEFGDLGNSFSGRGVTGFSNSGTAVLGRSDSGDGVYGQSDTGPGVYGIANDGPGVYGVSLNGHHANFGNGKVIIYNNGNTALTGTIAASNLSGTNTGDQDLSSLATKTGTETLTNKRVPPRITTITSSATPTINSDNCDMVTITAQAEAITSMTSGLTGTPNNGEMLLFRIKDDGTARAITWGASFKAFGAALPTTTVLSKTLHALFIWDSVDSKWGCISTSQEA